MNDDEQIIAVLRRLNELFPPDLPPDGSGELPAAPHSPLPVRPPPLAAPPAINPMRSRELTEVPPDVLLPRILRRPEAPSRKKVSLARLLTGAACACACAAAVYVFMLSPHPTASPSQFATVETHTGSISATRQNIAPDAEHQPLSARISEGIAKLRPSEPHPADEPDNLAQPLTNDGSTTAPAVVEPLAPAAPPEAPVIEAPKAIDLLQRGQRMLTNGNVQAARLLLERAAENGSAEAALSLANSYGADNADGNVYLARRWYQRAAALGAPEAQSKLDALGR